MRFKKSGKSNSLKVLLCVTKYTVFAVFVMFGAATLIGLYPHKYARNNASVGTPYKFYEDKDYCSSVDKILPYNGNVYLLYERKSIIQCFDSNGTYMFSWAFAPYRNGTSDIFVSREGVFVFKDQHGNRYTFNEDGFLSFHRKESDEFVEDSNTDSNSCETAIVPRPFIFSLFQKGINTLVFFLLLTLFIVLDKIKIKNDIP